MVLEPGQRGDARIERRLVDADDTRAGAVQNPAPAARAGTEIETEIARVIADKLRAKLTGRDNPPKIPRRINSILKADIFGISEPATD